LSLVVEKLFFWEGWVSEKSEEDGLDISEHAEEAYADEEEYKIGDKEYRLGKKNKQKEDWVQFVIYTGLSDTVYKN